MKTRLLALAACIASFPALASEIVPAQPVAFERVNLRLTVDSCAFEPGTVRVRAEGTTLKVTQQPNQCLLPGEPEVVDVQLGALAPGAYRVELFAAPDSSRAPDETLAFEVLEPVQIAVFPPPPRPLTDYTGMWWNPQESGWGLSLHQSASTHAMFGAWFVYGEDGAPEWFTLQGGRWTDATRWTGPIYRTSGPFFGGTHYDPRLVLIQAVGTAVLDFTQVPGEEGRARFTYTIGGFSTIRDITRLTF